MGQDSSVGIVTGYRLDGPGIESLWGARFSTPVQTGPGAHWVSPVGKEWLGRDADPSPPSSAVVKKGYNYTSTPPVGRMACPEPRCLYKGAVYLTLTVHNFSNQLCLCNDSKIMLISTFFPHNDRYYHL